MTVPPSTTPALGVKAVPALLRRIGEYDVTGVLGRGGFGVVYAAAHRDGGGRRAIKVLAAELAGDDEMIRRFSRESKVVNLIPHPSIITTLEVGRISDGRPYFVMDQVDGVGLDQVIRGLGSLALVDAIEILTPVCEALEAAHAAGIVHRDLKASNILVEQVGGGWRVWLTDFGIAKLLDIAGGSSLTIAGQRLGTPEYMAPEQVLGGEIDGRTDVYALGILLFHMLTGEYPFRDPDPREIERKQVSEPPALRGVSAAVGAVIARALEKLPRRRFASAPAFLAAVHTAAGEDDPATIEATPVPIVHRQESGPTQAITDPEHGEVAVAVVVDPAGPPALDAADLARGTGVAIELRTFDRATLVCVMRAREGELADDVAKVALELRRAAPDAVIVVRLAAGGATELHVAFNSAMAAVAPPAIAGAIVVDGRLAARLAGSHRIERRAGTAYLVPETS